MKAMAVAHGAKVTVPLELKCVYKRLKRSSNDLSNAIRNIPEGTRIALKPIKFNDGKPDACILGIKFLKDEKFRPVFPMFSKSLTKREARKAAKDLAEGIKAASTTKANTPAKTGSKLQVSA